MNDETQLTDARRLEKEEIEDLGTVTLARGEHVIHCLTVIGQIEGHTEAPQGQKTTKYEHVIPQLVAVQEDPRIEGLLVLLNTVGGDVETGLALAELIASISKPSATLVLGGGHSIGIPLAVSARKSFIVPTATMTVHPVRHSGMVLGVPQTLRYFEQMQERIVSFVAGHSGISAKRFTQLMHNTGELVMDVERHRVTVKSQEVELTKKEFDVLRCLLENKGRVLTREALLDSVWGFDFVGETNSVDVYIRFLRSKIDEAFDIKLIHTVRGVGYVIREE